MGMGPSLRPHQVHAVVQQREFVKAAQCGKLQLLEMAVMDNIALHVGWSHFTSLYKETLPVQQMKDSLERMLHLFPTFTGRLIRAEVGTCVLAPHWAPTRISPLAGTPPAGAFLPCREGVAGTPCSVTMQA